VLLFLYGLVCSCLLYRSSANLKGSRHTLFGCCRPCDPPPPPSHYLPDKTSPSSAANLSRADMSLSLFSAIPFRPACGGCYDPFSSPPFLSHLAPNFLFQSVEWTRLNPSFPIHPGWLELSRCFSPDASYYRPRGPLPDIFSRAESVQSFFRSSSVFFFFKCWLAPRSEELLFPEPIRLFVEDSGTEEPLFPISPLSISINPPISLAAACSTAPNRKP